MLEEAALKWALVDELADQIAICAARIDAALHQLLGHIRRFDALKGWSKQGCKSCAHWLSWRIGVGMVAAREKVRVATALAALPQIDAALARGELSYAKVRAMTRVANDRNEDLLLAQAKGLTGAELERVCAGFRKVEQGRALDEEHRYVRRRATQDGMVQIEMRLLPDEAERVWQALRETRLALQARANAGSPHERAAAGAEVKEVARDTAEAPAEPTAVPASLADAAVAMAEACLEAGTRGHGTSAAERRTLFIHLSERRMPAEDERENVPWKAELQDGTALSGSTLLRLACDSGLVVARTDERGDVLDIGRRRRTVPPAIFRALRLRDRGCRFPGCRHAAFVDAHHIDHWSQGGSTSLANLVLVCHAHHVALHEGGFAVEHGPCGELRFLDAEGRVIEAAPRPPELGGDAVQWLSAEQEAHGVRVDRDTSLIRRPFWGPDLDGCVRALVWRDPTLRI